MKNAEKLGGMMNAQNIEKMFDITLYELLKLCVPQTSQQNHGLVLCYR
jgi:hypothetical protein